MIVFFCLTCIDAGHMPSHKYRAERSGPYNDREDWDESWLLHIIIVVVHPENL